MNERYLFAKLDLNLAVLDFFSNAFQTISQSSLFFQQREGLSSPSPVLHFRLGTDGSCWRYGQSNPALVSRVIVCTSPLEAISWLSCHHTNCADLDQLLFVAAGDVPRQGFYDLMSETYRYKKLSLVLGADLLGRISDIKVATRIMGKECSIRLSDDDQILISYQGKQYLFSEDKLSLNAFEKACGLRSGIRTFKPKKHFSYFNQISGP